MPCCYRTTADRWICAPFRCRSLRAAACLISILALGASAASIVRDGDGFRVNGWTPAIQPADWSAILTIHVGSLEAPPLLGSYAVTGDGLTFHPRFAITPGVRVFAKFAPPSGSPMVEEFANLRETHAPSTSVARVLPSADLLPSNQLKLYLEFSAPMSRGEASKRVHLYGEGGEEVDLPFVEIEQELWDPEQKRLTMLFDPGRIKRGVLPLAELGGALVEGELYELRIDRGWPDAEGRPLVEEHRKRFQAGPADRTAVDPASWKITAPTPGTREPVLVAFGEPLDAAVLVRCLEIRGDGQPLAGSGSAQDAETQWRFEPEEPWAAGSYQLAVCGTLEDLAGNKIGKLFDVDTFQPVTVSIATGSVSIPFRIGGQ